MEFIGLHSIIFYFWRMPDHVNAGHVCMCAMLNFEHLCQFFFFCYLRVHAYMYGFPI